MGRRDDDDGRVEYIIVNRRRDVMQVPLWVVRECSALSRIMVASNPPRALRAAMQVPILLIDALPLGCEGK